MGRYSSLVFFCFAGLFSTLSSNAQEWTVQEGNFQIHHYADSVVLESLHYDEVLEVRLSDATSEEELSSNLRSDRQAAVMLNPAAGRVYEATAKVVSGKDTLQDVFQFATRSRSTGAIRLYFNHLVNVSVAQVQHAQNITNRIADSIAAYIDKAELTVDIAIYNATDITATQTLIQSINNAHTRGVRVRIVYESTSTNSLLDALNPAIPSLPGSTGFVYGLMHNKFVVIDANHTDPNKPWISTGSTNWTTAQLSGTDLNNVIFIQDQALALAYQIEFEEMWGSSGALPDATNAKFGPDKTDNTPHNFNINGIPVELYFSPSDGVNQKIIDRILFATHDINIATMLITRSDIRQALLTKYDAGLSKTHVLVSTQNPTGNEYPAIQAHLPVGQARQYTATGTLHHKFMVVDNDPSSANPLVLTGSHNWSTSAETRNDENTLIIRDRNITNQYYQAFFWMFKNVNGGFNDVLQHSNEALIIYPNPAVDQVWLASAKKGHLEVFDAAGRTVMQDYLTDGLQMLNTATWNPGIYIVRFQSDDSLEQYKLMKQ